MKITAIRVYQVDLPLREGRYNWSGGNFMEVFDSHRRRRRNRRRHHRLRRSAARSARPTCPPTPRACAPASTRSAHNSSATTRTDLWPLNHHMDAVLRGHPYVKAPIDIACWDILGQGRGPARLQAARRRACSDKIALYRAISQEDAPPHGRKDRRLPRRGLYANSSSRSAATRPTTSRASKPAAPSSRPPTSSSPTPTPAGRKPTPPASSTPCATSTSTSSSPASAMRSASRSAAAPRSPSSSTRTSAASATWSRASPTTPWTSST